MRTRMRFGPDDEDAFFTRRDELGEQFAEWLSTQRVVGDPGDADFLMEWKWGYGDGALDRWRVADVQEFLFDWCPRKLSATQEDCTGIPGSVAAFVEFLAHTGMLAGGDPASRIRAHCERSRAAFVEEMGNPANFGMAKSLFGSLGGLEPDADLSPEGISALLARLEQQAPDAAAEVREQLGGDHGSPQIGPVRLPGDGAVLASARSAPLLVAMRTLADYCAEPGRTLTAKGNVRLADARHLVEALQTGDDPTLGGVRKLTTAEELPGLSWYVYVAIESGVVRRQRGKLVAVARFAGLDDVAAYEKLARSAIDTALGTRRTMLFSLLGRVQELVDNCVYAYLFELLDGDADVDDLVEMVRGIVANAVPGYSGLLLDVVPSVVEDHLARLGNLGAVEVLDRERTGCPDCDEQHEHGGRATLTPIGVQLAVSLAREGGVEVTEWPDPTEATAEELLDLIGAIDEQEWADEVGAWFAAQSDPTAANARMTSAALAQDRDTISAMAGLEMLGRFGGPDAVEAVRAHLRGPHDGVVLNWLVERSALDASTIEPERITSGLIDLLAATLDRMGPKEVVAVFGEGESRGYVELLGSVWRLEHPRLGEVLEALGAHSAKTVAKAARTALAKHRSMLAERRGRNAGTPPVSGRAGLPSRS
ncbi:MAG: hypothetical protein L0I76_13935 [Pseudonocardia sp.]|nr:hypothetical protein [Pseudonocardia sp.]